MYCVHCTIGVSLECYVCTNQDQNHEKCLNTIKTCEPEEDMCLSEISWGCENIYIFFIHISHTVFKSHCFLLL